MPKRFWIFIFILVVSVFYGYSNAEDFRLNPFNRDLEFSSPYKFITAPGGDKYVIDNGKQRIVRINKNGESVYTIHSETGHDSGPTCMQSFTVDDKDNLYVHNYVQDIKGLFTIEEYIERYNSSGVKTGRVFYYKHEKPDSLMVVNWSLLNLNYRNGLISWIRFDGAKILYCSYNPAAASSAYSENVLFKLPDGLSVIASIDVLDADNYAYITKQGEVFRVFRGVKEKVYSGDSFGTVAEGKKPGELSVPGYVQMLDDGTLLLLESVKSVIFSLNKDGKRKDLLTAGSISNFTKESSEMFFRFSVSDESICLTDGSYIIKAGLDGNIMSAEKGAVLSDKDVAWNVLFFIALAAIVISAVMIARDFYVHGINRIIPRQMVTITGIIVIMIVTMVIAVNVLMPNFDKRYIAETENRIRGLTIGLSQTIDGDAVKLLMNRQSDYYNSDYRNFRQKMVNVFGGYNDQKNSEFYFVIYKDYGGELAVLMTQNDSYLPYQTYDWLKSEEDNIYLDSMKTGEIFTEKFTDSTGDWIYSVGPIRDSAGKNVAVIEIGKNFYAFNRENSLVRKDVVVEVITAIILVLMIFIEISLLSNVLWSKRRHKANSNSPYDRVSFSRFLGFLYEFIFSLPLGFIPVYAIKLLDGKSFMGIKPEMAGAFPITMATTGIVLGTVFAGFLLPKFRWRKMFIIGLFMAAAGLFLTGLSGTFLMFTLMMFFTGIGRGLLQMAARAFINTENDPAKRGFAFSNLIAGVVVGINVGVVVGGAIADHISYRAVFFASSVIIPVVILFILFVIERTESDRAVKVQPLTGAGNGKMSLWTFLSRPRVWGFFLLICIPNAVAYMFLQYTFLIVAEGAGFSTTDVGRSFILNGMAMFYLGPLLYSLSVRKIGLKWTMISSIIMWSFSLMVFAFTGNITGAIVTIFIMGISEGYGNGAVYIFYTDKISEVNEYGVDKALAVNEFMTNMGMAAGPLIFGAAMLLGQQPGMMAIAVTMIVLAVVYFVMHALYSERGKI